MIVFLYFTIVKPGQEERRKICMQKFKTQLQNGGQHFPHTSLTRKHIKPTNFPSPVLEAMLIEMRLKPIPLMDLPSPSGKYVPSYL